MNTASWITVLIIAILFVAVIVRLIINKKCNKHSCSGCAMSGICHNKKE